MNTEYIRKEFISLYGRESEKEQIYFAPGRVCLIGEHIDYNGGLVVPAAISLGIYALARPTDNNVICMKSSLDGQEFVISLDKEISYDNSLGWANYPLGMVNNYKTDRHRINGCEILFHSTLPVGSGLSSSAAIEVLTGFLLADLNNIKISKKQLALSAKEVENNFIGVKCGIMDQFAVTFGEKDKAIKLNCTTLEDEMLPLQLTNYKLVIFNTNKKRELTESAFNKRTEECKVAFQQISKHHLINCLADGNEEMVSKYVTDATIKKRAYHVVTENKRVAKASDELKQGNIENFGRLLFDSHHSLRYNYEVSGKELDTFVDFARQHPACVGAKMTGAGFGGCAVAIVKADAVQHFMKQALEDYFLNTGIQGEAYIAEISEGVRRLD
jgi:galactokinase